MDHKHGPYETLLLFSLGTRGGEGQYGTGEEAKDTSLVSWQAFDTTKMQVVNDVVELHVSDGYHGEKEVPLDKAIEKVLAVMSSLSHSCIATNGSFSLRQILFPEVSRKLQKSPPTTFHKYFDLQKELSKRSNYEFQPKSLADLCEYLGVDHPSGGEVSAGRDEIHIMAKVVQKMLVQGHVFESPEVISQNYQHSNQVNSGDVYDNCVVKLRGLPYSADHKDIAMFLSGLNIIPGGVVFSINAVGRRTGEAIVVLENEEQSQLALMRDRHYLNQRYIEVYESSPDEFLQFSDTLGSEGESVYVIRIQGLPYRATERDIVSFFGSSATVKNGPDGIMIVRYPDGKASGDAFAVFPTERDLEEALKRHRENMMGRYIELFHSSLKEFLVVLNKSGSPAQLDQFSYLNPDPSPSSTSGAGVGGAKRGSEKNCVKLRGLPWEATPEDIIEFFGELSQYIEQHGIHMVLNAQNRPTGDCYIQMMSVDSAQKAAGQLHKRNLGRRYVEVFQCSGNEVTYALMDSAGGGARSAGYHNPYQSGGGGGGGYKRKKSAGATVKARGLPFRINEHDLVDFFGDFDIDASDVEIIYSQNGRQTGVAYISFSSPDDAQEAVRNLNNKYIGHRYVELSLASS